jgi:MFS family permease
VTVAFFTLFGFIFLVTQYFQFVRSYSPLSTGLHTLPTAISLGIGSVFGTRLALRFGTKRIVTLGLLGVVCFYAWASTVEISTAYVTLAAQMIVFGIGMGFATTPATEAVMGVVPEHKAGVGSAINDTTRMVGGALGVAVIGSTYASIYSSRVSAGIPVVLPHNLIQISRSSIGGALAVVKGLNKDGWVELGAPLHHAALAAFHDGLSTGCLVAAAVALMCAIMVARWLPQHPQRSQAEAVAQHPPMSLQARTSDFASTTSYR